MEQLAPPGTIRLTVETLRLAEGWIQGTPLGPVPVKGLPVPVEVGELIGAGPAHTPLQAFAARGLTPFVGRQAELATMHQALQQSGAGRGQIVAVIGEPGVGKTRLLHEFLQGWLPQDWLLLESRSTSYGKATPYLSLIDLLKAYFQLEDHEAGRQIREKLTGRLFTLDPTLGSTLSAFLALLEGSVEDSHWQSLDPTQRRQPTLSALKRLVLRKSQMQPLLLVFENLHWIDAETQAFLDGLVESLPTVRLLLLVNYRPEYQHGWSHKSYYTQLRLDPLPPVSAEAMLQSLLGDDAGLEPLKQRLIERTQGNPFCLEAAYDHAERTLALARTHRERGIEAYALRLLGEIAARRALPAGALAASYYQQALALAQDLGMRPLVAHCHRGFGTLYANSVQREQALTELSIALEFYRAMEMTFWLPQTEAVLAQVHGR